MYEYTLNEEACMLNHEVLIEGASFSILPKFKKLTDKYPELKKARSLVEEANEFLDSNDSDVSPKTINKIIELVVTFIKYSYSLGTVLLVAFSTFEFPILTLLIGRIFVFLADAGIQANEANKLRQTIEDLKKLKNSTDDEKVKDKCDQLIKNIKDHMDKLKINETYTEDDDKVSDKTKEVANECILRLYEKAALCESVEEATPYIEKAEELQKAIDDIPEETPVNTSEYDEDVVGGKGESDDEAIKDLLDGDSEALTILTSGEGSVVVDD